VDDFCIILRVKPFVVATGKYHQSILNKYISVTALGVLVSDA
jgi:hypothetical protein